MNELDLKLYELLGSKTLSFGCLVKLNSEKTQTNAVFLRHSETYKRDYLLSDK